MPKSYMVRMDFPKPIVTCNPGTKYEFKTSLYDVFYDTLEEAQSYNPRNNGNIELGHIRGYRRLIWRWDSRLELWCRVSSDYIRLK